MLKIIIGIFAAVAASIFITTQDVDIKETNDESIAIQIEEIDTSGIEFKKLSKPRPLITNTVTNSDELYDVLLKANNGDVIYIPGQIKVDLTPTLKKIKNKYPPRFEIPAGVIIMGDGERFGENGATLYITDDVKDEVFRLNEGVNVIGLRI
ncbi:hypothetical protein ACFL5D_05605 [Candidatus Neomarinimicrobiota bacterium]